MHGNLFLISHAVGSQPDPDAGRLSSGACAGALRGTVLGCSYCCPAPPGLGGRFLTCSRDPPNPQVSSPADLTGGNGTVRPRCKDRVPWQAATAAPASRRSVETTRLRPPPWGAGFSGQEVPLVGSGGGGLTRVCLEQLLGMGERE